MTKLKYEIVENIASVPDGNGKDWNLEINLISWNDKPAKYDIRRWYREDGEEKMSKGITMSADEWVKLKDFIKEYI